VETRIQRRDDARKNAVGCGKESAKNGRCSELLGRSSASDRNTNRMRSMKLPRVEGPAILARFRPDHLQKARDRRTGKDCRSSRALVQRSRSGRRHWGGTRRAPGSFVTYHQQNSSKSGDCPSENFGAVLHHANDVITSSGLPPQATLLSCRASPQVLPPTGVSTAGANRMRAEIALRDVAELKSLFSRQD